MLFPYGSVQRILPKETAEYIDGILFSKKDIIGVADEPEGGL